MTLPLVYMDVINFAFFLAIFSVIGVFIGWNLARRKPTETQNLLDSMRRADHILDSYIVSIQGEAEDLIKEFPVDASRWKNSMELIIQSAVRMDEHVKRLRLIRRGLEPFGTRVAPVNLAGVIEKVQADLYRVAENRNITLEGLVFNGPNRPVTADRLMLEEIFTTLLDNAIKHNPPGTQVAAELTHSNDMALVRISDNGKGIDGNVLRKAFEPGGKDNRAGAAPGSGIGLFIAKTLTEIHRGTISVESELGKGSVFSVELPYDFYRVNDLDGGRVHRAMRHARLLLKLVPSLPRFR